MADDEYLEVPTTPSLILELLQAAYMDASLDTDGDVVIKSTYRHWAFPGDRDIRLMSQFTVRPDKSLFEQLEYVNRVNDLRKLPRLTLHVRADNTQAIIMDWYLPATCPVAKRELVAAIRRFTESVDDAVGLDTGDVIA